MRLLALPAVLLLAWMLVASTGESDPQAFRAKLGTVCDLGSRDAERSVRELRTLRAPESLDANFRQFVNAIEESRTIAFALDRAGRRGDDRAKERLMDEAYHALGHADSAAERLRVAECRVPMLSNSPSGHVHE